MLILNNLIGFGSGSGSGAYYDVNPIDMDSGYLTRTSAYTADANGKTGTVSFWFNNKAPSSDTTSRIIYDSSRFNIIIDSGLLFLAGYNSGGTIITRINSAKTYPGGSGWHHYMASWDNATDSYHCYIDGVSDQSGANGTTNADINYNLSSHSIGASTTAGNQYNGDLAEFYLSRNYIDLSVQANRDKFITQYGYPVYLGATGTLPNGSQPIIYLKGLASAWEVNSGYGGNFTRNGTIATAATTPSEQRAIVSYRNAIANSTDSSTTHTFNSVDIGRPATNRYIILAISVGPMDTGVKTISSVDIGGTSATALYQPDVDFTDGSTSSYMSQFWAAAMPTGTTATVTITYGGTGGVRMDGCGIGVYAAYNLNSITPIGTDAQGLDNEGSTTLASFNITTQANGFAIGQGMWVGASAAAWTGITENFDGLGGVSFARSAGGASGPTTTTSLAITVDPSSSGEAYPVIVGSWR